jgi:membrane-associated protease RseP (regulator of RpoE activity)
MKATQFFVGFGPTLWSFRRGETEYGVKAVPAGGFVKIIGMTTAEQIEPADEHRAFYRFPAAKRTVVLAAGSCMHFVIAIGLVYGVVVTHGLVRASEHKVGAVVACDTQSTSRACAAGDPASPAAAAGLRTGDEVVSLDGHPITRWTDFTRMIRDHGPGPVTVVVKRGGEQVTLVPVLGSRELSQITGQSGTGRVGYLGVSEGTEVVHENVLSAVPRTGRLLGTMVKGVYEAFTEKLGSITKLYSHNRDPNGFVGVVGASRVSADVLTMPHESLSDRVADFVLIVASLNFFVGIFNLLPLLPLDGGHIAIVGFEQARHRLDVGRRRRQARRAGTAVVSGGQAAPVPLRRVDYNKVTPATVAVFGVLMFFSLLILGADIVNPIRIR